ncbi:hypothetical protein M9978_02550 [Sphingomonas sp. MG17]|uniref:Uncharacterized protein n=1 Tax=Sphingomonas tagetis TaxID=2949092 RepID=A0A9X2KK76_9SPHN|nr:hypothetical protein [Sphingomonas tagetis]MCP3729297.1 hypothetical protein [Sphingomonas tagetis]
MTALPENPTGEQLIDALRVYGISTDRSLTTVARLLSPDPWTWINNIQRAEAPQPLTIARVAAVIAGETPPPQRKRTKYHPLAGTVPSPQPAPTPPAAVAAPAPARGKARPPAPVAAPPPRRDNRKPWTPPLTFEQQLERLQQGARLVEVRPLRRADHAFTLGGVGSGML